MAWGLSRVLSQPVPVIERGLDALQGQLKLPSRAALLLYLR